MAIHAAESASAPVGPSTPNTPAADPDRGTREPTTAVLLRRAQDATDEVERSRLLEEVVLLNLGPARRLARRYAGRGVAVEDLEQVAYTALVLAARRFDPTYGSEFLAYAATCIRGELRKHFRDHAWMVRPTRQVQEMQPRINAAREELGQELGRSPRPTELAEHLGVGLDVVIEALAADGCFSPSSLDRPFAEEGSASLADSLPAETDEWQAVEARLLLEPLVARLDERDRRIVELRFVHERTQQEIADDIGVTQMHVSRLLRRILAELREQLERPGARGITHG
ncbi:sigma-70 family RNA polymerase sigma factor [Nocardioides iriomotensis]|uniref:Sigma-70 family RNA polymerase sigma factor n=1 Tax=Nocardioides iriomotensis TaxID=715784 RepID=A0A4Q5IZE2_9ACTN|nr:sigma-70 family RNA polymerase sigma factor [Nocardioides iriomotensis]RYU10658.1 sigma-70 family RNA polymerase sigma factor [Nocardioides iriomotensis]